MILELSPPPLLVAYESMAHNLPLIPFSHFHFAYRARSKVIIEIMTLIEL